MNFRWRKSARSNATGNECVECGAANRIHAVRDSKDPEGPQLHFSRKAWVEFLDRVRTGRFDLT